MSIAAVNDMNVGFLEPTDVDNLGVISRALEMFESLWKILKEKPIIEELLIVDQVFYDLRWLLWFFKIPYCNRPLWKGGG
jgi:hypothetical protein